MSNKPNKIYYLFFILSWVFSVFFFVVFLKNSKWLSTPSTKYDLTYLIVFFVFFILPFISYFKLGQIEFKLKKPVEESESEEKPKAACKSEKKYRTAIEFKILNTLWRRQVLKFPELNGSWTFRLNAVSPEFKEFREAGSRLIGEGLISETDTGYFLITTEGLNYCDKHYKEFPSDMWFKDVTISKDHFEKLHKNLKQTLAI